nr:LysM peptidoglycan-binding domain-containing protein [Anaeromonas frigoriresistens]
MNIVVAQENTYEDYYKVFVREGDTIWEIAHDHNPYGEDVRKIVYEIEKMNNLESQYIRPGDIIKVPRN